MALTQEQRQKLINAGYSASKISAYERTRGVSMVAQSGFSAAAKDVPSDLSEAFTGATQAVSRGIETARDVRSRVESGETTPLAGTFQTIGGGLKAGAEVVGEGFMGLLKSFVSPKTEESVAGVVQKGAQKVAETEPVQKLALWYAALPEEQKRNVDASVGVGEGLATVFGAGPITKAARAGLAPVSNVAGKAAPVVGAAVGKTAQLPMRGVSEVEGALTGTSGETIRQAFNAARRGGKELDEFTAALRSKTTPEQLVNQLREGTERINAEKSARFGQMLEQIGDKTVDTRNIVSEVTRDLEQIGVKVGNDGVLDFSGSKFRTVPQAASKLQSMYDEVVGLGEQQTVRGIDTSRQALGALLLSGDDASARTANLAITNAISRVRGAGKTVDGYGEALVQFGDDAEFLSEISRALSSGDQSTIDTAYRKLATTLKTNNEQRRNLLMELDEATDGFILSSVAGQQLSEELPRGLFRQIAAGIAGASVVTGGVSAGIIPALFFASPRVTGEVLRALGIATGKIETLLKAFGRVSGDIQMKNHNAIKTPIKTPIPSSSASIPNATTPTPTVKGISPDLLQEARKFDTAEEFVKAQERTTTIPISEITSKGVKNQTIKEFKPSSLEYAQEQLKAGKPLEPIMVRVKDGKTIVEDGEHRLEAYRLAGIKDIPVKYNADFNSKSQLTDLWKRANNK